MRKSTKPWELCVPIYINHAHILDRGYNDRLCPQPTNILCESGRLRITTAMSGPITKYTSALARYRTLLLVPSRNREGGAVITVKKQ